MTIIIDGKWLSDAELDNLMQKKYNELIKEGIIKAPEKQVYKNQSTNGLDGYLPNDTH